MTGTHIENGKLKKFNISSRTGKCTPRLLGARTLCCNQVLTNTLEKSQHLTFSLTLTARVNMLFIKWNAYNARCNMSEKQRQHLT